MRRGGISYGNDSPPSNRFNNGTPGMMGCMAQEKAPGQRKPGGHRGDHEEYEEGENRL